MPNSDLPSRTEAWARLRSAGVPDWVLGHTACVEALAVAMGRLAGDRGLPVDMDLIQVGAALHDVGRSLTQDPTHAYRGARLLEGAGLPAALVLVVERHTGAGLTADDAAGLGLPATDLIPTTWEQKIVAHADNLYSGTKRLSLEQVLARYEAKGLAEAGRRIQALHAELADALGIDPDELEPSLLDAA